MNETSTSLRDESWMRHYTEITRIMYRIRRLCPRVTVLGISTLSPRHPIPPDQLELVEVLRRERQRSSEEAAPGPLPTIPTLLKGWLRCFFFACRDSLMIALLKARYAGILNRLQREPATVLLRTWGFGPDSLKGSEDFYYGTLPQQLQARGISCVLLCGDATSPSNPAFLRSAIQERPVRRVPELLVAPVTAPVRVAVGQWFTAWRLRRLARRARGFRFAQVCARACRESIESIAMRNALQYHIARAAVAAWKARIFVTFYEGQPWEQPAWHGAKAADPRCVTVGYQHTVIMRHSLSVLSPHRGSWELSAPEVVLCLGSITQRMMQRGHVGTGTRLVDFGTYRRAVNGLCTCPPQPSRRTVLVLPEGNLPESQILFGAAMQAAGALPGYQFIFRCHPLLPFSQVRGSLWDRPERYPNIELSTRASIAEEFKRSSVVLYRGSSAVLYAVLHGLKAVYLHAPGRPEIDPLFETTSWRESVTSIDELEEVLRGYAETDEAAARAQWQPVAEYVEAYTRVVDGNSIERFLAATHVLDGPGGS